MIVDVVSEWRGTPGFEGRLAMGVEKLARDLGAQWQANIVAVGSVDTGAYLNSVEAERDTDTEWVVHDGVEHGIYNELGTHSMAARPALQPAVEKIRSAMPSVYKALFA